MIYSGHSLTHSLTHSLPTCAQGVINYVYIPEGNKSHAMYWTTEYWIPELVSKPSGDAVSSVAYFVV